MKNLPVVLFIPSIGIKIMILVLFDKLLVFFDRSIRIPRAHARIHKVFYPCNRCHLATLLENQRVTCGNEVTRVTTNGVFALNIHSTLRHRDTEFHYFSVFIKILHGGCEAPGFEGRRCRLRGLEVPPPRVGGAASMGRSYGLQSTTMGIVDEDPIMLNCNPTWFAM